MTVPPMQNPGPYDDDLRGPEPMEWRFIIGGALLGLIGVFLIAAGQAGWLS